MPIPLYLAMTSAEFQHCSLLPEGIAWMACHFSSYGTGISNRPPPLPEGSLLILNDRIPVCGHDPQQIAKELFAIAEEYRCAGILLDLQHANEPVTTEVVQAVCWDAPCPVAVSESYCNVCDCAVFLSAPPLHESLSAHLAPWQGRQIWLEVAPEEAAYCITKDGCRITPLPCPPKEFPHRSTDAFCSYHIAVETDTVRFSFRRSQEDVEAMLENAENIHCMVGLYQQLK